MTSAFLRPPIGALRIGTCLLALGLPGLAFAQATSAPAEAPVPFSLHGQYTATVQYHPAFDSPYAGANSLDPGNSGRETNDITLFGALRLWTHAALYVNPEIDQGFGLSDTYGVAGFPSGEAYKVGARRPYFRLPRVYFRQGVALDDGAPVAVPDAANQMSDALPENALVITVGKFSVVDIFDTNRYAHDPRADFLNWSVIDAGAFDYPADAWAFTYGAVAEWSRAQWTLRGGLFALSKIPNGREIDGQFSQFGTIVELERRHRWGEHDGKLKALVYMDRGRMGSYDDAVDLAVRDGAAPSTALVRRYSNKPGIALNLEQELASDLGAFARASANDGRRETYEFTDVNKSLGAGLQLTGQRWSRADDAVGLAIAVNAVSTAARRYFAAGGLGPIIGDGRLPDYGLEHVLETYYALHLAEGLALSADYQLIVHPAYNVDRGPVQVFGLRFHAEF
jgi:high affinity Mn2+ porin